MKNTTAVVTLYNPKQTAADNLKSLAAQVTTLILSDNSPSGNNAALFSGIKNAVYIRNGKNLGLSGGINRGLQTDEVKNSDYVFFFDQDSEVPEGHIDTMIEDWERLERDHRIGLLGAHFLDEISGNEDADNIIKDEAENKDERYLPVEQMITSSMLTKYPLIADINFWNEEIFLDFADYDLCWRFLAAGYELFITKSVCLRHSLGDGKVEAHILFSKDKKFTMGYSAPFRKYYQTRALMKLRKTDYVPENWKKWLKANLTVRTFYDLRFLPDKRKRFCFYLRGLIDGARGKSGELKL